MAERTVEKFRLCWACDKRLIVTAKELKAHYEKCPRRVRVVTNRVSPIDKGIRTLMSRMLTPNIDKG